MSLYALAISVQVFVMNIAHVYLIHLVLVAEFVLVIVCWILIVKAIAMKKLLALIKENFRQAVIPI